MDRHTRHDRFFRAMMRFPSFQQAFIAFHVPTKITAPVNLEKLEPVPESFVRANKTIVPDCILRAPFKETAGWAYFPIEQQTNPSDHMSLRAVITKGRILEFELSIRKNKIPPLIWHIVFCNGQQHWRKSLDLFESMPSSVGNLVRWALTAPPQLIQLVDIPDAERGKFPELDAAEMLMKRAYEDPIKVIGELENLLEEVLHRYGGMVMLQAMIDYMFPGDGHKQADDFILRVEKVVTRQGLREIIMSFSEIFRQQGMQQGKLETARNMLREGIPATTITKVTGLSRQKLTALLKK